ncbi:type II toxin-antitoxin system YafQ family toxin [Magnetococcales bacterium HHB-1]
MLRLQTTKRFDRDLKLAKKRGKRLDKLKTVIDILRTGQSLDKKYRAHKLTGNWAGYMECHIESDWLLIWLDEKKGVLVLTRLGSHSDLFR